MIFAQLTAKLVGQAYKLGQVDCFSAILQYLEFQGVEIPDEYQGQTRDTYAQFFQDDPVAAKGLMVAFMAECLDEIKPHQAFAGDIMLLTLNDSNALPFLAINGGNGNIIAASESRGVSVTPLKHYTIGRCWRCPRPSR